MGKGIPKYLEVVKWIKEQLENETLKPGQKIYSENEISEIFNLSRQTVRHAISVLENEGIINRVQGSGTYINDIRANNRSGRKRIAVVTTYLDGYIFPRIIHGIENVLFEKGFSVQISFTNNLIAREKSVLSDILERNEVAGIIVETTKSGLPNPNLSFYRDIMEKRIPVLFINSYYPSIKIPHVTVNDKMAGKMATKYLIDCGHKKIAGIFKLDDGQGHLRYLGYIEAMEENKVPFEDIHIIWIDTQEVKNLKDSKDKIIKRIRGCSAVVAYNDEVAFALINILKQNNINVPQDISIVGIDNSDLTTLSDVKITSIPHPMEKLGEKAAENLIQMINNPIFDGNYEFDVTIVERDSVRKIDSID